MKILFKGSTIVIITFALVLSCNDDFLDVQPKAALGLSDISGQKGLEALLVAAYSMLDAVGEAIPAIWGGCLPDWCVELGIWRNYRR